jgi:hypothetical protein
MVRVANSGRMRGYRGTLKSQYGRLFYFCLDKDVSVADMRRLGWGFGINGWRWRKGFVCVGGRGLGTMLFCYG